MSLLRGLTAKPWETKGADLPQRQAVPLQATATLGLSVFLGVVTVLFLLLISAYFLRMSLTDWTPLQEPPVLWLNSALLVLSSLFFGWALHEARRDRIARAQGGLLIGGVFGLAFFAGQIVAWRHLADLGYFAASNPAYGFFYLITALHGLHLLGGAVAWAKCATRLWPAPPDDLSRVRICANLALCARYWHYLLALWLVLFGLMLADNGGRLDVIAICRGFVQSL